MKDMRVAVIGCGYLGAVHAAAMASLGHATVGIDVDDRKVASLSSGVAPFYEPDFDAMLEREIAAERLSFTTDVGAVRDADVVFLAVGTPQVAGADAADLRFVRSAVDAILPHLRPGAVVVGKSTVPVGTASELAELVAPSGARLMWNPEFLREGFAVQDTLRPDRIVYGVVDGDAESVAVLDRAYAAILETGVQRMVTDLATAELVKVSANAFLATKISFINAIAEVADAVGADVTQLADAIGLDDRIGRRFLNAGLGFGGGCLPKDIRAFRARGEEIGQGDALAFLREVDAVNLRRRSTLVERVEAELVRVGGDAVAVLGLSFKPDSDDVRDSPALDVATRLHAAGHRVRAYDPKARSTAASLVPDLDIADTLVDAVRDADVLVLGTEWREFRDADPAEVAAATSARVVVDGRNALDRAAWSAAGFRVVSLGRPVVEPA